MNIHIHTYTYTFAYTCIHVHMYTYTHTRMYMNKSPVRLYNATASLKSHFPISATNKNESVIRFQFGQQSISTACLGQIVCVYFDAAVENGVRANKEQLLPQFEM